MHINSKTKNHLNINNPPIFQNHPDKNSSFNDNVELSNTNVQITLSLIKIKSLSGPIEKQHKYRNKKRKYLLTIQ